MSRQLMEQFIDPAKRAWEQRKLIRVVVDNSALLDAEKAKGPVDPSPPTPRRSAPLFR